MNISNSNTFDILNTTTINLGSDQFKIKTSAGSDKLTMTNSTTELLNMTNCNLEASNFRVKTTGGVNKL